MYDDAEAEIVPKETKEAVQEPKKPPTREEMETKLLPKYTNALNFALNVLDKAFIQEEAEAAPGSSYLFNPFLKFSFPDFFFSSSFSIYFFFFSSFISIFFLFFSSFE